MDRTPRSIADYDEVMDPIRSARQAKSGNQPGDILRIATVPNTLTFHQDAFFETALWTGGKIDARLIEKVSGWRDKYKDAVQWADLATEKL